MTWRIKIPSSALGILLLTLNSAGAAPTGGADNEKLTADPLVAPHTASDATLEASVEADIRPIENPVAEPAAGPVAAALKEDASASSAVALTAPDTAADAVAARAAKEGKKKKTKATRGWGALEILGKKVKPGTVKRIKWSAGQSFAGSAIDTPVVVIRGRRPGPTLCLTAAIHGDELNGVEIVRRVIAGIEANELAGTVIGAPIVNLLGFTRGSRYLPDRRDLNRYFPGSANGSSASRIAHVFFSQVVQHCDRLVDFHTGSFKRTNLPQLRANLNVAAVREFVERFGATSVLHKSGQGGTLRNAATSAGIPTVAFELGEPGTLQLEAVAFGVRAIDTLLDKLEMVDRFRLWSEPQPIFYRSRWLRAYRGGILTSEIAVGTTVRNGDVLGVVTNPVTSEVAEILSPYDGRLLGRALNQFVLPGFATFHIGIESREVQPGESGLPLEPDGYADDDDSDDAVAPQTGAGGAEVRAVIDERSDDFDEELH